MPLPTILSGNVASALPSGYEVDNSSRWDNASSMKMTRTPSGDGNLDRWTWSFWIKLGNIGTEYVVFHAYGSSGTTETFVKILSGGSIEFSLRASGTYEGRLKTNRLLRDPTGWMHLCFVMDTPNSTSGDRMIIYVNGVRETSFSTETYPDQNQDTTINDASFEHTIGSYGSGNYFDGYMAEIVLLDGTAASITDFGEFDSDSPTIWKPKDPSGLTFGTNGFYLDFKDSSNLGNDANGGQDWTEVNFDATDQATDTCTNNFCTMSPIASLDSPTMTEGLLKMSTSGTADSQAVSTIGASAGRWYFEIKIGAENSKKALTAGISDSDYAGKELAEGWLGMDEEQYGYVAYDGKIYTNDDGGTAHGDTMGYGDIMGVYVDLEDNKLYYSKNGTLQNSGTGHSIADPTTLTTGVYMFCTGDYWGGDGSNVTYEVNFGNPSYTVSSSNSDDNNYGSFEYSPNITGDGSAKSFYSVNTKNLAEFG